MSDPPAIVENNDIDTTLGWQLSTGIEGAVARGIPDVVRSLAAMLVASTVASAAAGRAILSSEAIRSIVRSQGGRPEATIWFDPDRSPLPIVLAARANATASSASASDSSDLRSLAHPGTPVVAAALALGEAERCSGSEVIDSIVIGYEISNRIAGRISPAYKRRGLHGSMVEIFGAAATAVRLFGGSAEMMTHALALSASSIGGLMSAANTSTNREYSAGLATMLGIEAARAAVKGFCGEPAVFETAGGFFAMYGDDEGSDPLHGIGQRWGLQSDMAVKLMPGGVPRHAIAEASARAMIQGELMPEQVEFITISKPGMRQLTGPRYPIDLVGAAHSPAYFAAAAAADRSFTWAHAAPEKLRDPVIVALLRKVRVDPDPLDIGSPYRQGATVVITTVDGRRFSATVEEPLGSAARGLDWGQVTDKYRTLVSSAGIADTVVETSLEMILGLESITDVNHLAELLKG